MSGRPKKRKSRPPQRYSPSGMIDDRLKLDEIKSKLHELSLEEKLLRRKETKKTPPSTDPSINDLRKDKSTSKMADKMLKKLDLDIPLCSDTDSFEVDSDTDSDTSGSGSSSSSSDKKEKRKHTKKHHKKHHRKGKSGYEIKAQRKIKKRVKWPHGYCGDLIGTVSKDDLKPDNLTQSLFVLGYVNILNSGISVSERQGRMHHLKTLMNLSITHGWEFARTYHYKLLRCIEYGLVAWSDNIENYMVGHLATIVIQDKDSTPVIKSKSSSVTASNVKSPSQRTVYCISFNKDEKCQYDTPDKKCSKLHACKTCGERGWLAYDHSSKECKRTGSSSKVASK